MNKTEYLDQLQKYLKRLPGEDYDNAMEYFTEYFEEVGEDGEQKAIEELGTPKEAAAELISHLLTDDKPSSIGRVLRITCLAVFAAPIALPIALAGVALILAGILLAASLILCMFLAGASMVIIAVKMFLRGLAAVTVSTSGIFILTGTAIFGVGCSILVMILAVYASRWLKKGILKFSRWMIRKRGI